ncbi:MAG TPA: HAD hydrolase-like protein, partial [Acidimicrobiales bacterium]|nr:HAD hydrolase-like protein [Acidimicrobiales bacterium]
EDRRLLVPVALRRLAELRDVHLGPQDTWVVGDTERDLACARAGGAHCVLVATGRYSFDELSALGADAVVADLSRTEEITALLSAGL